MSGRFQKGRSGNPAGRPRKRRPDVSAFDVIFDRTLTVSQNGVERELSIDEALQLQTYQAALKGSRMAVRAVLKMIEKREEALAKLNPGPVRSPIKTQIEYDPRNADEAMLLLGITVSDPNWSASWSDQRRMKLATWAAQAGLSRPGRKRLAENRVKEIRRVTLEPDKLRWPRSTGGN